MALARWGKPLTLLAMCLGLFMPQLDTTVVNLALPSIQHSLNTDVGALQWIIDGYNLTFAALLLTGGTLGDLFGRKRLFLLGLLVFAGGSLLCGLASDFPILLMGRILQGIGAALELPATLAIVTVTYSDPKERAWAMGIWASIAGVALAIGPTAGAFLLNALGWQSIFFLNLPIGVLAIVLAFGAVGESSDSEGRHIDLPGQTLAALFLITLTSTVIESQAWGWRSPLFLGGLVLAVVWLATFVFIEQRTSGPMVPLNVFRVRAFSAALAVASMMTFGMYGMFFLISLYLQTINHTSPLMAGLQQLPLSLTFILVSLFAGRLMSRIGPRWLTTVGMALMGIGLFLLMLLVPGASVGFVVAVMSFIGIGVGLNMGPVLAVAMGSMPASRSGMASGFGNVARMVGATLGVAILGACLAGQLASGHTTVHFMVGLRIAFLVGGSIELIGCALAWLFIPRALAASTAKAAPQERDEHQIALNAEDDLLKEPVLKGHAQ